MKTVQAWEQAGKRGAEYNAIGGFADDYLSKRFPDSVLVDSVRPNADIGLCRTA